MVCSVTYRRILITCINLMGDQIQKKELNEMEDIRTILIELVACQFLSLDETKFDC